jgi:hypothetical protein
MNRSLLFFSLALVILSGCTPVTWGNGIPRTEQRPLGNFSRIEARGGIALILRPAAKDSMEVSGDANIVPLIRTEINGDTLQITATSRFRQSLTPTVVVRKKGVTALEARTLTELHIEGPYPHSTSPSERFPYPRLTRALRQRNLK